MENESEKIGFFKRVQISVAKLENYNLFLEEKTSVAVKYFFLVVLFLAIVIGLAQTYHIMKMVTKGYTYIENELPDFSYQNNTLKFTDDFVYGYDEEYDMYLIADTSDEVPDEKLQEYRKEIKSSGLIFLKDKLIYRAGNDEADYVYSELQNQYELQEFDKDSLVKKMEEVGIIGIAVTIFGIMFVSIFILQMFSVFMDWLLITIFAFVSSRICRVTMTVKQCFNISIYSLTLPIILSMLYNVAYYVGGFYTDYFRTVYLLISYIYVVAAILMMKSDVVKQQVEIKKIEEVEKQVHEETEKQDEEEKEENKTPDKEDENEEKQEEKADDEINSTAEPDGSEI